VHHEPPLLKIIIEFLFIVVAAYLFAICTTVIAELLAIIVVVIVGGLIMYPLYTQFSVLFNPLFPIIGMVLHRIVDQYKEVFTGHRHAEQGESNGSHA
jgi:phosphotransferase system  glucose/maltose/N-acetylglucosamine-specific IIC component